LQAFLVEHGELVEFVGNRTECALLMLLRRWGVSYKELREENHPRLAKLYGFSSERKMASVLYAADANSLHLYNKVHSGRRTSCYLVSSYLHVLLYHMTSTFLSGFLIFAHAPYIHCQPCSICT
jgi:magnesium-transporting ATPase (P-type)